MPENQVRSSLIDSILKCTHGDLNHFQGLHRLALERDPLFYGHLAGWYMAHGTVRDHQELFVANLLATRHAAHREHGRVLLQRLRPYQVGRVVRFTKESLHYPTRMLKSAVEFYLRRREADTSWFDECVIRDRKSMRHLYATMHIRPSDRAEQILFQRTPPVDSRVHAAALLGKVQGDPERQAELILAHHIHYTTAIGSIRHYTPSVLYALVKVMTGPQIITNLNALKKRGALDHPGIRPVIEEKLRDAVRDGRVSELKAGIALQHARPDAALASDLLKMTQDRLRNRGRLTLPTALFVDKSGSMEEALKIGRLLATVCSTLADDDLHVLAFDSHAFPVGRHRKGQSTDGAFAFWERAFELVRADGATSVGAPFRALPRQRVEQIVVITDGEENTAPLFRQELDAYEALHGVKCLVVVVLVGGRGPSSLEQSLQGREVTIIRFDGDYYSLPNVVPLLCNSSWQVVEDVLATPLHRREDLQTLPTGFDPETYEIL
ncbi:MAG TPA: hypothetical protein VGO93_12220 [Candidatus Xenobia bacterium]|jgi:hypothetical protein